MEPELSRFIKIVTGLREESRRIAGVIEAGR